MDHIGSAPFTEYPHQPILLCYSKSHHSYIDLLMNRGLMYVCEVSRYISTKSSNAMITFINIKSKVAFALNEVDDK